MVSDEQDELKIAYEEGKKCALDGKDYFCNPYRTKEDCYYHHMAWTRGFREHKTPDPHCRYCRGTGYFISDGSDKEYDIGEMKCYCNKK